MVIAFDIDGVLTKEEGIEEYRKFAQRDVETGVITARRELRALKFTSDNNLEPDFLITTRFKGRAMRQLGMGTYFGSGIRDRVKAKLAGWEYKQL